MPQEENTVLKKMSQEQIERHPLYILAMHHINSGHFATEKDKAVFWCNNPKMDVHSGRSRSRSRQHAETLKLTTMGDLERKYNMLPLDWIWEIKIPEELRNAIGRACSADFAKKASGTAWLVVDKADPISIFREVELPALMNNPKVTNMPRPQYVKGGLPYETVDESVSKDTSYHNVRDKWLNDWKDKYEKRSKKQLEAIESASKNPKKPYLPDAGLIKKIAFAQKTLISEIIYVESIIAKFEAAKKNGQEYIYLFSDEGGYKFTKEDMKRETARLEICKNILAENTLSDTAEIKADNSDNSLKAKIDLKQKFTTALKRARSNGSTSPASPENKSPSELTVYTTQEYEQGLNSAMGEIFQKLFDPKIQREMSDSFTNEVLTNMRRAIGDEFTKNSLTSYCDKNNLDSSLFLPLIQSPLEPEATLAQTESEEKTEQLDSKMKKLNVSVPPSSPLNKQKPEATSQTPKSSRIPPKSLTPNGTILQRPWLTRSFSGSLLSSVPLDKSPPPRNKKSSPF